MSETETNQPRKTFGLNPEAVKRLDDSITKALDPSSTPPEDYYLTAVDKLALEINETEQRAIEAEKNSITDSLTGLYNRRYLDDYIKRFDNARNKKPVVVAFCDADNLGAINKLKGDIYGDQLIRDIANILKSSVRNEDLVIRKGGDEFVIIIEDYTNFSDVENKLSQRLISNQSPEAKFSFSIVEYDFSIDKSLTDTIQRGNVQMKENNPGKKILKH